MEKPIESPRVNVAAWEKRSVANGPGERFVLWVQGCPFRCPGCFNPDYLPFQDHRWLPVDEIAAMVRHVPDIEGVTFSGGEPMAQAQALWCLSQLLKTDGLSVVCYSGYTLEELLAKRNPWVHRFLECIDILIDGRYEETQRTPLPWRGSRNQRVHFLTQTYRYLEDQMHQPCSAVEFVIGKEDFVSTGILNLEFLQRLEQTMQEEIR